MRKDVRIKNLQDRVDELERRVQEAGRRALFHANEPLPHVGISQALADVGRALLFDPETPNPESPPPPQPPVKLPPSRQR